MQKSEAFFDANGEIGYGARRRPDFPSFDLLVRHMDRLGIARSLVWNTQARDHHPVTGNRRLLAELDSLNQSVRRRLEPSLVAAPGMLYEPGAVEELADQLKTRAIRAIRLFPNTHRYHLSHFAPLLEKIAELKPVLFLDMRDCSNEQDLLDLAGSFRSIPIVCTHGMWPTIWNFSLLNVMRQRQNVLIDNSWHHTCGTLEMIVRDFGPDRIVFATGGKSHNGAAVAQILAADLEPRIRGEIAHGNLEKLLGLAATEEASPADITGTAGNLWHRFVSGRLPDVEIIDAHGHLGSLGHWPCLPPDLPSQVSAGLGRMDRLGVKTMIVSGMEALFANPVEGNQELEKQAGKHAGRYKGYLAFNPIYEEELSSRLDDFFDRGFFVGFKFLCDYWQTPVTDRRLRTAIAYADAHRMPILLHTWDNSFSSPALLRDIVREFPDAFFLLGHSGGGNKGRQEAVELARENENVCLEWCGSFCSDTPWEQTILQVGNDRVIFGTDAFCHDIAWELGRFLSLDLPDSELLPILGDNMRKILAARR